MLYINFDFTSSLTNSIFPTAHFDHKSIKYVIPLFRVFWSVVNKKRSCTSLREFLAPTYEFDWVIIDFAIPHNLGVEPKWLPPKIFLDVPYQHIIEEFFSFVCLVSFLLLLYMLNAVLWALKELHCFTNTCSLWLYCCRFLYGSPTFLRKWPIVTTDFHISWFCTHILASIYWVTLFSVTLFSFNTSVGAHKCKIY